MKFKKGDKVKLRTSRQKGVISGLCKGYYHVKFQDWGAAYAEEELELVPELEQKSRFALEVTDTEFVAVSTLGPYVELSINDDERLDLYPEQARHVAMMLRAAAEVLEG